MSFKKHPRAFKISLIVGFAITLFVSLSILPGASSAAISTGTGSSTNSAPLLQNFATLPSGLNAEGIALSSNGYLYVGTMSSTHHNGEILAINPSGSIVKTYVVRGLPNVGQVAFLSNGTLVGVAANHAMTAGALISVNVTSGKVSIITKDSFKFVNGLTISSTNLFETDLSRGVVFVSAPNGSTSLLANGTLLSPKFVGAVKAKLGTNDIILGNNSQDLYVTNTGQNTVLKIPLVSNSSAFAGVSAGPVTTFSKVPRGDGLAFGPNGNLYVTSPFTNSIWIVTPNGTATQMSFNTSQESFNQPTNVIFNGTALFITNSALLSPHIHSEILVVSLS